MNTIQIWGEKLEKKVTKSKKENAKLRNNAIFRKSIENSVNKVDLKIVGFRRQCWKWSFRPTFKREKIRNGALPTEKEKCRMNLNKPINIRSIIGFK